MALFLTQKDQIIIRIPLLITGIYLTKIALTYYMIYQKTIFVYINNTKESKYFENNNIVLRVIKII